MPARIVRKSGNDCCGGTYSLHRRDESNVDMNLAQYLYKVAQPRRSYHCFYSGNICEVSAAAFDYCGLANIKIIFFLAF
jgi:hypothetical protein